MIYFITDGNGYFKIGYTENIEERLSQLNAANPNKLKVIHIKKGGLLEEKILHNKFYKYRKNGEWFENCKEIRDFIKYDNKEEWFKRNKKIKRLSPKGSDSLKYGHNNFLGELEEIITKNIEIEKEFELLDKDFDIFCLKLSNDMLADFLNEVGIKNLRGLTWLSKKYIKKYKQIQPVLAI
ncbi:MAG: GIY-YIG nuclease family protein [Candidatus Marinimicrobia bacterium]|nr:GIY-YIG nuclease family protein [Candidatus Neomarinimicrobiota bacterium]